MNTNQSWTKYEAAILLDAFVKIRNSEMTKKDAIKIVSFKLRKIGINLGINISQTYRNENGIQFQLQSMESAFHNKKISKPATLLFKEIVNIYFNNNDEFKIILKEANAMINNQESGTQTFFEWLSVKMPSYNAERLCNCLKIAEDFCLKIKVLSESLIDTKDPQILKKFKRTIEQNKIFRILNKKNYNNILSAVNEFSIYRNKIADSLVEEIEVNNISEQDMDTITDEFVVDFQSNNSYAFTKPTSFTLMGEQYTNIKSWTNLYIKVFEALYRLYPNSIPINTSFTTSGRMDFCHENNIAAMVAPKSVANNMLLETNLSATYIVKKIKSLLSFCSVNNNELQIKYSKSGKSCKQISKKVFSSNQISVAFYNWMLETEKMSESTCKSYLSAINVAEQFAKNNDMHNIKLCTDDYLLAKSTFDELFANKEFIKINELQHNRFRAAINKLLSFIQNSILNNDEQADVSESDLKAYMQVLLKNFSKGFRFNSPLELRKFKRCWQTEYNEDLIVNDQDICKNIMKCGVIYEDKIFLPETMLESKVRDELFEYITNEFASGKTVLYYESIFKEFSDTFLNQSIYTAKMLKAYLEFNDSANYYLNRSYLSKEANVIVDIVDEVRDYLYGKCYPTNYNDMFEELSHIPELKIRQALSYNSEFINNGKYEYFHVDSFHVDDTDLICIKNLISKTIEDKEFLSGNELIELISRKCPQVLEHNSEFSEVGIRDAIAYKLKYEFSFKGNIISDIGNDLSMATVFENFCKSKSNFSLDELKILKNELKTVIYFDSVYNNSLRISETEFVSKEQAQFNLSETDKAIDRFCDSDYIPIKKISQFGMFPDAGFIWNSYLLEHYVAIYSPNYKLVHSNYNESACVGAIVKKLSDIDTFDDVLIDAIANSDHPLTKQNALQYFCDEGYLARRSYSKIEEVLIKAKELRNQKGY